MLQCKYNFYTYKMSQEYFGIYENLNLPDDLVGEVKRIKRVIESQLQNSNIVNRFFLNMHLTQINNALESGLEDLLVECLNEYGYLES